MGSVYKVSDGERDYYGSTTVKLYKRFQDHKRLINSARSNVLNRDKLTIELMEEVEDESQLTIREQYYLDNYECVNVNRAHNTPEYNQEYNKKYLKEYRKNNRDKLLERAKTKITCVCGAVVSKSHKAAHERTQKHINKIG